MREDILGALQSALIRGETLKKAMMTLYNAGYKKEEIEESAAALQQMIQQKPVAQAKPIQPIQQSVQPNKAAAAQQQVQQKPVEAKQVSPSFPDQSRTQPPQIKPKPKSNIKLILIIFSLIILIGILIGAFLFSSELIEFFNNVFN